MNLYLISRTDEVGYDEYDSAVVIAESMAEARKIHPGFGDSSTWVAPKTLRVKLIGLSRTSKAGTVICASFNAG